MMYAIVVRRLKPGAYERFRRAWEPDSLEHWPAGMTKMWIARSEDDRNVIATWSLFELDQAGYEALRDDPEWMSAELGRVEAGRSRWRRRQRQLAWSTAFTSRSLGSP